MDTFQNNYAVNLRDINGTKTLMSNLKESMDSPLNGTTCPYATLDYFWNKPLSVVIKIEGKQAAMIGFSQNIDKAPDLWLTTTLLFTKYRGTGLNMQLKRLTIEIAKQNAIPLGSIIRDWNIRSLKAMENAFPGAVGKPIELRTRQDFPESSSGFLYDLRNVNVDKSTLTIAEYDSIVKNWWQKMPPQ